MSGYNNNNRNDENDIIQLEDYFKTVTGDAETPNFWTELFSGNVDWTSLQNISGYLPPYVANTIVSILQLFEGGNTAA